jgi:hypothetical protein
MAGEMDIEVNFDFDEWFVSESSVQARMQRVRSHHSSVVSTFPHPLSDIPSSFSLVSPVLFSGRSFAPVWGA